MIVRSLLALALALLVAAPALAQTPAAAPAAEPPDPVVARVNGIEIHRSAVLARRQSLPEQAQKAPIEQIYRPLLAEMENNLLVTQAGHKAKLDNDPEVKRQLALALDQIVANVYITRYLRSQISEEKVKQRYDDLVKQQKPVEEVNARHILLKTEDEAKAVIADLNAGKDFAEEAKAKSEDPGTKASGGDLGWFTKEEMVPEFAEVAFKMQKGQYTDTPVKTQFGYHVIKVEDRRTKPPPSFDEAKGQVFQLLQREFIEQKVKELRTAAKIEEFNLDGSKLTATPTPATPAPATPAPAAPAPATPAPAAPEAPATPKP
jgi:peptidyl-prolyl cis-trans isomerase C